MPNARFFIAQIGRTVGLYGDLKFNLHTDFPEQFKPNATIESDRGTLTIATYNPKRNIISFVGYASITDAKRLTNTKIYSDLEQTRTACDLGEGEYFWFDIIGSDLYQGDELLGCVEAIDRMVDTDYLRISTEKSLVESGLPISFILPYIPRYIVSVDSENRRIDSCDARDILEAS